MRATKTQFGILGTIAALTVGGTTQLASADFGDVEPTKLAGDMIAGSGIPADSFTSNTSGGVGVYLKARARDTGDALLIGGNTYIVKDGVSSNPARSWWQVDFQFTPRENDVVNGVNYVLKFEMDTDPTTGTSFITIDEPIWDGASGTLPEDGGGWENSDGYELNPGPGSWSNDDIDYVYSQSWSPSFGFWFGTASQPAGDYVVRFTATHPNGHQLAQTEIRLIAIPAGSPALVLTAEDSCLNASEDDLSVAINMVNASSDIVGGQFFLEYDTSKLTLDSADAGDAPFTVELYEDTPAAGELDYAVNIPLGGSGTSAATTMARVHFTPTMDFCSLGDLVTFRAHVPPTRLTEATGPDIIPTLVDLSLVTKDSLPPVLVLPSDVDSPADAGTCEAVLPSGVATATDDCDTTPNVVATRSDTVPLASPFPPGDTTITWTATDDCGNSVSLDQTVSVGDYNLMDVLVELQDVSGSFDRCITFELRPDGGGASIEVEATLTFTGGLAAQTIEVPCGLYDCAAARDTLHTLRSRDDEDFGIVGTNYVCDFTSTGTTDDSLVGGNLNDDEYIDILDFGVFIGQYGLMLDPNTPCHDLVASSEAFGYEGVFSRYSTLADAETSTGPIASSAIPARLTAFPYDTPSRDGSIYFERNADLFGDQAIFLTNWYYTTMAGGGFGSGNPNNLNPGFVQMYDADASTVTSWDGYFAAFDGTYFTEYHLFASGVDTDSPNDFSRLWNVPSLGSTGASTGGEFRSWEVEIVFTGLEGVPAAEPGFIEFEGQPTGASGTFTAVFENIDVGGSDDTAFDGFYRADLDVNTDIWAAGPDGYQYDAGGNIPGLADSYFYGTQNHVAHSDINGDMDVDGGDYTFIAINFLEFSEASCDASPATANGPRFAHAGARRGPVTSITVGELAAMGLGHLAQADLTGDGVLDEQDMAAFFMGARPPRAADVNGDGLVNVQDLMIVLDGVNALDQVADVNDDDAVNFADVLFVLEHMGTQVG